jgi:hypothetical protein
MMNDEWPIKDDQRHHRVNAECRMQNAEWPIKANQSHSAAKAEGRMMNEETVRRATQNHRKAAGSGDEQGPGLQKVRSSREELAVGAAAKPGRSPEIRIPKSETRKKAEIRNPIMA